MAVSIIVPTYNAEKTIADTLTSVINQTRTDWEAIIVNDGSSDSTPEIIKKFSTNDGRIRVINQDNQGLSAARNTGIRHARHEWLVFLDADDWLLPPYLERMLAVVAADPGLDAVHCSWASVTPSGFCSLMHFPDESRDLFPEAASSCPWAPHCCILRRSLIEFIGDFDVSIRYGGEDWDFWQRLARFTARIGAQRQLLAHYRLRPNSLGKHYREGLIDGLRILSRSHGPDPRVLNPRSPHERGMPAERLPEAKLRFLCWPAGLMLGKGGEAKTLLQYVKGERTSNLDPYSAAHTLVGGMLFSLCRLDSDLVTLWPDIEERFNAFINALEELAGDKGLARRIGSIVERRILDHSSSRHPITIGRTHSIHVDCSGTAPDLVLSPFVERLRCNVEHEGLRVGVVELPVSAGRVWSRDIHKAITREISQSSGGIQFSSSTHKGGAVLRRVKLAVKSVAKTLLPKLAHRWMRGKWNSISSIATFISNR